MRPNAACTAHTQAQLTARYCLTQTGTSPGYDLPVSIFCTLALGLALAIQLDVATPHGEAPGKDALR